MKRSYGGIISSTIIAVLIVALIVVLLMLFVRDIGCEDPYENDATIGNYWIHFEVGNDRPECVQPPVDELYSE